MKQAWQAQFMAAAYRASEEEWERSSVVSSHHPSASATMSPGSAYGALPGAGPGLTAYPMPPPMGFPMPGYGIPPWAGVPVPGMSGSSSMGGNQGMNMNMNMHAMGMGMGMGMYPFPSQHPPLPTHDLGYSYGPTTQSVFGGEFGPPALQQQQHHNRGYSYDRHQGSMSMSMSASGSVSGGGSPSRVHGHGHVKRGSGGSGGGVGSSPRGGPPSSWRRKSGLSVGYKGDEVEWDDEDTPKKGRGFVAN
jgi:hypothetical protein